MKKENLIPTYYQKQITILAVLLGAILVSFFLDSFFLNIISTIKNASLDFIFTYITDFIFLVLIMLILPTVWLWFDHNEKKIIPLWLSFFLTGGIAYLLKVIVQRPRPTDANLFLAATNSSFPSLHTATAFSIIALIAVVYPKYTKYFIGLACLIAFTRMYFGLHYLSDIIAGATLGYFIGYGILYLHKKRQLL